MARLVARALRLGRSALIQTSAFSGYHERYRLSYLVPLLMWDGPVILVAPEAVHQRLLLVEIPQLRQWIQQPKSIQTGDRFPDPDFQGLLLVTPEAWLSDRLHERNRFPEGIPVILDSADDLENWVRFQLTTSLEPADWNGLMLAFPEQAERIRDIRVQLTKAIFQRPANPYECHLIEHPERDMIDFLFQVLGHPSRPRSNSNRAATESSNPSDQVQNLACLPPLPESWQAFWRSLQVDSALVWADITRSQGHFVLRCGPADLSTTLEAVWSHQAVVLVGGALDLDPDAAVYRQRLGLGDLTCLKFSPDRHEELIHLYLPEKLPMPNTPQFQTALVQEMYTLLSLSAGTQGLTVLIVGDVPLKAQVGSILASEFGSRVQVERTCLDDNGVLVTGWEFWRQNQQVLPAPHLLAIATLPIPSLEHPLVAGRVAYYKKLRQDWFRLYLLPSALSELQRAIAPVRERQGIVALLDSRVIHRSYGHHILAALNPLARVNYLDLSFFPKPDYSVLD
jgi:ATP-dependent DNA helicase DinG